MWRPFIQRGIGQTINKIPKRAMASSTPNGANATSPHYADFGYGANQMLPTHEILKNPYPYRWQPKKTVPTMVSGHHPELDQHQVYSQATGYSSSLVAGVDHYGEHVAKQAVIDRVRAGSGFIAILAVLTGYEIWMWDGIQFPQQPLWDELNEINLRMAAHSLQWQRSWKEMKSSDVPMSEVYEVIAQRPFKQNNPYNFSDKDLVIADKNVSYLALDPALKGMDKDEYRKEAYYTIFWSDFGDVVSQCQDPKQLESHLNEWLYTQNKFTMAELEEIIQYQPSHDLGFVFSKNAVFDDQRNEIVFFENKHRFTVEDNVKPRVKSIKDSDSASKAGAYTMSPLLKRLIHSGPKDHFEKLILDASTPGLSPAIHFLAFDSSQYQDKFDKLMKLSLQVQESADNSVETFQANAKGLGLPVPQSFGIAAINAAIFKATGGASAVVRDNDV